MNNFEKIIQKAGTEYSLSGDERAKLSRGVHEYMKMKPLARPAQMYSVSTSFSWFAFTYRPVAAALVLVMVFGSGVSYAAEAALPGDALYSIKTLINEPTRLALATNAEAKAEVRMELAERRIEEATILAAEGRLDDATQEKLAVAFEEHATAAASSMSETESADDTSASIELASRFENRLVAHESILAEVAIETEQSENVRHSSRLSDAIRATSMVLAEARSSRNGLAINVAANLATNTRMAAPMVADSVATAEPATMAMTFKAAPEAMTMQATTESDVATTPPQAPDQKTISRMHDAAEKSLKAARKALRNAKYLNADARVRAESEIEMANTHLEEGNDFLTNDMDADAYFSFEESARIADQATVYIKAAPTLEKARARAKNTRVNINENAEASVNVSIPGATVTLPIIPVQTTVDQNPGSDRGTSTDNTNTESPTPKNGINLKLDLSL